MEQQSNLERYGTIHAWSLELGVTDKVIMKRLENCQGISGKDAMKRLTIFYAESIVRNTCADLLQDHPQADADAFIYLQSENGGTLRYDTVHAWSKECSIPRKALAKELRAGESRLVRAISGQILRFYPETAVQRFQEESGSKKDLPVADEYGFFVQEQESRLNRFGTMEAWMREWNLSPKGVALRLKNLQSINGRVSSRVRDFFSEEIAREACADLFEHLPIADETSFFSLEREELPSERYGTSHAWAKNLEISHPTMRQRLADKPSLRGRNRSGMCCDFYSESVVREACANLLSKRRNG